MDSPRLTPPRGAFLVGTPLAWAVLLLFYAGPEPSIGGVAWIVAVIAAAVAYRGVGAPLSASILPGLSATAVVHAPPVGPVALVLFAAAVVLLALHERAAAAVDSPEPTPALGVGLGPS